MSYTNIDIIRNHIEYIQPITNVVTDQKVLCNSDEYIKIFNGAIQDNSVQVKTITSFATVKTTIDIETDSFTIYPSPLVQGTLLCASDSSLGTIYKENIDYVIDYNQSTCTLKTGGQLNVGMTIVFFFLPYSVYSENSDYHLNLDKGEIQRVSSGNIQIGETLYIDYIPVYNNYSDEIIQNAVTEANAIIELQVDPEKQFGANLVLQTAATYRALEILCRSSAMRELINQKKNENAVAWIKLAELYLKRAEDLIVSFKAPSKPLKQPTHS